MSNVPNVVLSIGAASTAALSFGAYATTASNYEHPNYHFQANPEHHALVSESFLPSNPADLAKLVTDKFSASGPNSLELTFYTSDQLVSAAKEFIFGLKNHQVDIDLDTKALISENLWDLYD